MIELTPNEKRALALALAEIIVRRGKQTAEILTTIAYKVGAIQEFEQVLKELTEKNFYSKGTNESDIKNIADNS